jgi:S1-C subfamily serine protease
MVLPPEARHEDYKTLDIQAGDIIKMANGKTMSKAVRLKEIYDGAEFGDVIKLGVLRDGKMMMRKFAKADPDKLPGQVTMMTTTGGGGAGTELIDIGLVLGDNDGVITVDEIINNTLAEFDGPVPDRGDVITEIQGNKVTSIGELSEIYKNTEPGEKVGFTIVRQGKQLTTSCIMPDLRQGIGGQPMIIKKTVGP